MRRKTTLWVRGGGILIQNKEMIEEAEIVREKGTNRSQFFRGEIDKYTWMNVGSSYVPSELNAAYLYAQLENADDIYWNRMNSWNQYYEELLPLRDMNKIEIPIIPENCQHNAHMFYIKVKDLDERKKIIQYLKKNGIYPVFHYVPLHSSPAGKKFGQFSGEDIYTTKESERLLRLPLYFGLKEEECSYICEKIKRFYI